MQKWNRRLSAGRPRVCLLFVMLLLSILLLSGCSTVQPWQKGDLALAPMDPAVDPCLRFERNIEVYREGAVGANGGKSGGGCGCS